VWGKRNSVRAVSCGGWSIGCAETVWVKSPEADGRGGRAGWCRAPDRPGDGLAFAKRGRLRANAGRPLRSVAGMPWRRRHVPRVAGRTRRGRSPEWLRTGNQARVVSIGPGDRVVGCHRASLPIRCWPPSSGRVALQACFHRRTQIAAVQAVRLGAQERRPAGADAPGRRPQSRLAQDGRDRGRGDTDTELQQLTLDSHVAPARVLPRHPLDQATRLGRKRGTTRPATASSSASLQQCPVPAAKSLRADRKTGPALGREQPADRSEQGSVDARVLRPPPSALQDRHLVAQNHDLELALTATAGEQTNANAKEPVQQTGQQNAQSEPPRP
jgi:hypothetical protein